MPDFTSGRTMPAPDEVDAHPDGASWAGIMDLVSETSFCLYLFFSKP